MLALLAHLSIGIPLGVTPLPLGPPPGFEIGSWEWQERAKLQAPSPNRKDLFGWVALEGDTAAVGASQYFGTGTERGYVCVFERTGDSWQERATLTAGDSELKDRFGNALSLSGDTILIGAPGDDGESGSAYVFVRSGSTWVQQAKLRANDPSPEDYFGMSVSLDGDTAVIGSFAEDDGGSDSGAVYVFDRSGTTWNQSAKIKALDAQEGDWFGLSVSHAGDRALIGAPCDHDLGIASGAAYLFERSGTTWTQRAQLHPSDLQITVQFGYSVSLNGNEALIGGPGYSEYSPGDKGCAYIFKDSGSVWTQQARLLPGDGDYGDRFGHAVSLRKGTAVIGAPWDNLEDGSAYVFARSGTAWNEQAKLTGSDAGVGTGDLFGIDLAFDGATLLIGALYGDPPTVRDAGLAYVFEFIPIASAEFRNGGTNPASYDATTQPVLGMRYDAEVNVGGSTGHSHAVLAAYTAPLTFTLPGGQTVLVNPAGPELLGFPTAIGPVATFSVPLPNDPALLGYEVFTQAAHFGGPQPFALSNARDLLIGH